MCVCVCKYSDWRASLICVCNEMRVQHLFEMRGNASRDERLWVARMRGAASNGAMTNNNNNRTSQLLSNGDGNGGEWLRRQHEQQQQQLIQQGWLGHGHYGSGPMRDDDAERSTIDMYEDALAERSTIA